MAQERLAQVGGELFQRRDADIDGLVLKRDEGLLNAKSRNKALVAQRGARDGRHEERDGCRARRVARYQHAAEAAPGARGRRLGRLQKRRERRDRAVALKHIKSNLLDFELLGHAVAHAHQAEGFSAEIAPARHHAKVRASQHVAPDCVDFLLVLVARVDVGQCAVHTLRGVGHRLFVQAQQRLPVDLAVG